MKNSKLPILYLVAPCYNEEETLEKSSQTMLEKLLELEKKNIISRESKILFVNDGSKDKTEEILNKLVDSNSKFSMLSFLANAGHQNAIYAGMVEARKYADIVVTIDVDLQQDINALEKFIEKYKEGNDVVYGVRNDRSSDGLIKKTTASIYYGFMKFLGSNVLPNSADYRLLSKKALDILAEYQETNLFLRGLIPSIGLKSDVVYFDVKARELGESKYTFKKMFNLAISGITSFSSTPMHLICLLGGLFAFVGVLLAIVFIFVGYTNTKLLVVLMLFLSGCIIGSLGIVGEYVATANIQVKNRPRYIIDYVKINNDK